MPDKPQQTVIGAFLDRVRADPGKPAVYRKVDGRYRPITWSALAGDVQRAAVAWVALGLRPGERVAQLSENRYEWIVSDLAVQMAGGVHVPLHASLTAEQARLQIEHSGAGWVLVSTERQARKLAIDPDRWFANVRCWAYDDSPSCGPHRSMALQSRACTELPAKILQRTALESHARIHRVAEPWSAELPERLTDSQADAILQPRLSSLTAHSLATILYTSGTLGEPKGVMLSQGNLFLNAQAAVEATGETAADVKLCYLPLSHVFARTCDLYKWVLCGGQLVLAESRETVLADCAATQPTWINAVPYFYDKVRREVVRRGLDRQPDGLRAIGRPDADVSLRRGAGIGPELYDFYWSRGVPLYTGYGLTETSPVLAVSGPAESEPAPWENRVARAEVTIAADGEVLTRGPYVMLGYWQDESATQQAVCDGWLHTGDLGRLDADGFLYITGRKKEILVTSGGKKIAPAYLEALLMEDPLIEQVLVVGEGRDYLAALLVPNRQALDAELAGRADADVQALFRARIQQRLARLSHYEQIGQFVLLDRPFSMERGELTPKQSLRRAVIIDHFAPQIAALYANLDTPGANARITPTSQVL